MKLLANYCTTVQSSIRVSELTAYTKFKKVKYYFCPKMQKQTKTKARRQKGAQVDTKKENKTHMGFIHTMINA